MAARIKDVAQRAGVSIATVSRVLANHPYVKDEVREAVREAMRELNYQPSRTARSLRVRQSRIIGLIISDILNPFFHGIVRAVEDVASANQYAVFLCNTDEDAAKEELYISLVLSERVAGVIISPSRERDDPSHLLVDAATPVVVIDRQLADLDVDTVATDSTRGAYDLVSHLIGDGHRTIGAVLGDPTVTTGRERFDGYRIALEEHGIAYRPELVRTGIPREPTGYGLTSELLALPERPSALFTGNNLLTLGALRAIRTSGLRIPEDVALAGFDEVDWMSLIDPGLTVAAQATYELGRTAAELLLRRIAEPQRPVERILRPAEIKIRQSCARHPAPSAGEPAPVSAR
jgi:DNA-binding LacI/PurR family transcriptional regulator